MYNISLSRYALLTGQISNTTKIGRLAKMIDSELISKTHNEMKFTVFGDNLIGKTIKAVCIGQEGFRGGAGRSSLQIIPSMIDTEEKIRPNITSIQLMIKSKIQTEKTGYIINVSGTTSHSALAKRLHELYMKEEVEIFTIRCMGYRQSATVIKAIALFNSNVSRHQLVTTVQTENVPNMYLRISDDETATQPEESNKSLRAIVFNVRVVDRSS
jgi:hypothetical protein